MNKLKAFTLFSIILVGITATTPAEAKKKNDNGKARAPFLKGDNTLGFSVGLGTEYNYYSGVTNLPAVSVHFDHGFLNDIGPGTIGIGGVVGIQTSYYNISNGNKARWTNIIVGARGTYHLTLLKDKNNKFDPYGGVTVGIRSETYSHDNSSTVNPYSYGGTFPFVGAFVGAKYNFSPHLGVFSELGFDISFLRIGLNLNF